MQTSYNFLIVGDNCVGKTAFITRMATGEFSKKYNPTISPNITKLVFATTHGEIIMKFRELSVFQEVEENISGAIIMFDTTNKTTYKSVPTLYNFCKKYTSNIVLCGNKVDNKNREVGAKNITFHRKCGIKYFDVSARSTYHFEKPYLALLQELYSDNKLNFVDDEPIMAPEVDIKFFQEYRDQMAQLV